ncbi:hypothetical protein F5146DRAFT_99239 [Armillaria mellea]|nr:hypothetical protein F5146DRAFT_99239 [Armillaria mellea]
MSSFAVARAYQHSFRTYPSITLACIGGTMNGLGDVVAQASQIIFTKGHEQRPAYDFHRTFRFFCFGFAISPLIGRWNKFLECRFPIRRSSTNSSRGRTKSLAKRVACDQIFMAPIGLALFLGSMGVMEGRDLSQIQEKYKDLYKPALITNWQVWPVAQLINFRFMPLPYRVPFQSTCGVFWTLYLSIINSNEDEKQDRREHSA